MHLLQDESTRLSYQKRINQNSRQMAIWMNINIEWKEIKAIIVNAASEALGEQTEDV